MKARILIPSQVLSRTQQLQHWDQIHLLTERRLPGQHSLRRRIHRRFPSRRFLRRQPSLVTSTAIGLGSHVEIHPRLESNVRLAMRSERSLPSRRSRRAVQRPIRGPTSLGSKNHGSTRRGIIRHPGEIHFLYQRGRIHFLRHLDQTHVQFLLDPTGSPRHPDGRCLLRRDQSRDGPECELPPLVRARFRREAMRIRSSPPVQQLGLEPERRIPMHDDREVTARTLRAAVGRGQFQILAIRRMNR